MTSGQPMPPADTSNWSRTRGDSNRGHGPACRGAISATAPSSAASRRDALVDQLYASAIGALDLLCIYLGDRLGLYRPLACERGLTPAELAVAEGVSERYAREWLEQQTVSGILETTNPDADDDERRYRLPAGHDEALTDETSLAFIAPLAQSVVGVTPALDLLLDAFRTGEGVPYEAYGRDASESQARSTRPVYEQKLATEWLPAVPDLHARLQSDPPARIADVACGYGHSTLAIARGYPNVLVEGIDLDAESIAAARKLLAGSGVEGRVSFHQRDAADPELSGRYDPVEVLQALRSLLAPGGSVLVADERTAERFSPDTGAVERLQYGFSVLTCLPVGMTGPNPAGTGTVMRPDTLRRYATQAGFAHCEILPIEERLWRFYRLRP
jgi:2-polyprenyl-3-methyl-5-hydroxy-6-metoxy-1,4-benzoquinol methylase